MSLFRKEIPLVFDESIIAADQAVRSPEISAENAEYALLLLHVEKIGSPTSETVVIYVLHVDRDGTEYIDSDTSHGTITVTGSTCPLKKMVSIPYLGETVAIKAVGGAGLSSSTGFRVSARLVPVLNTDVPGLYME